MNSMILFGLMILFAAALIGKVLMAYFPDMGNVSRKKRDDAETSE